MPVLITSELSVFYTQFLQNFIATTHEIIFHYSSLNLEYP